jgi:hypothetical protein
VRRYTSFKFDFELFASSPVNNAHFAFFTAGYPSTLSMIMAMVVVA